MKNFVNVDDENDYDEQAANDEAEEVPSTQEKQKQYPQEKLDEVSQVMILALNPRSIPHTVNVCSTEFT